MNRTNRWQSYALGVIATAALAWLRWLLGGYLGPESPLLLFICAVMAAAWHGGFWPGLFTTLLSLAVGMYLFVEPQHTLWPRTVADQVRVLLYLLVGATVSVLCEVLHRRARESRRSQAALRTSEQALLDSERRFRLLLEGVPQLVWTCDAEGRCDYLSRQWVEYTGVPEAEQLGYGWVERLHPDDRPPVLQSWQEAVQGGAPFDVEFRIRGADGAYRWFKTRAVRFTQHGSLKWLGTNTDIHDKKLAEERLKELNATLEQRVAERTAVVEERSRALAASQAATQRERALLQLILNSIGEAVIVADRDGRFLLSNPAAAALHGQPITDAAPADWGKRYGIFLADGTTPCPVDQVPLHRAIHGYSTDNAEFIIRSPAAPEEFWVTVTGRPMRDETGNVVGGVVIFRDVSARRRAETALRASLNEKDLLLKEVHHRVKNNLQIVSTLLDLQAEHTRDPAVLEMFQESRRRVRSMALIHDRLYRSHDLGRIDFADYLRQLVDDLYHGYKTPEHEIAVEIDVQLLPLAIDVAVPCGLLLNELISNCFKHAFRKVAQGRVRVVMRRELDSNVLTVADNGVGLPPGIDLRNTPSFGLQLVGMLVEQLRGTIAWKNSTGTEITVTFPSKS